MYVGIAVGVVILIAVVTGVILGVLYTNGFFKSKVLPKLYSRYMINKLPLWRSICHCRKIIASNIYHYGG